MELAGRLPSHCPSTRHTIACHTLRFDHFFHSFTTTFRNKNCCNNDLQDVLPYGQFMHMILTKNQIGKNQSRSSKNIFFQSQIDFFQPQIGSPFQSKKTNLKAYQSPSWIDFFQSQDPQGISLICCRAAGFKRLKNSIVVTSWNVMVKKIHPCCKKLVLTLLQIVLSTVQVLGYLCNI